MSSLSTFFGARSILTPIKHQKSLARPILARPLMEKTCSGPFLYATHPCIITIIFYQTIPTTLSLVIIQQNELPYKRMFYRVFRLIGNFFFSGSFLLDGIRKCRSLYFVPFLCWLRDWTHFIHSVVISSNP